MAKAQEERRQDYMFPGADRILRFRSGGKNYTFARMPDGRILATLNGEPVKKPSKAVMKHARTMMARADVDDVHRL
jgi:hypothetical protein